MASRNLPLVRAAAEAILIGLFPLVVIVALMGGVMALRTLMFYFGALVWIQMWGPVASILNYVLTVNTRRLFLLEGGNGVISPGNADGLLMAAADAQAAAGAAMWLIPVIAAALAWGGKTLMSGMLGMTSSAKAGAEAAGSSAGAGNYNMGNMSLNNSSANQMNLNPVYTNGATLHARSTEGESTLDVIGGERRFQGKNSNLAVSPQVTLSQSENYSRQAARAETEAKQWTASAQESYSAAAAQTMAWMKQHSMGQTADTGWMSGLDASQGQKWNAVMNVADEIAQKHGISNTSEVSSRLGAQLGVGTGGNISASGGWGGSASNQDKLSADISKAAKALRQQGIIFDNGFIEKVQQSEAFKASLAKNDTLAQGAQASLQKAEQASFNASRSHAESQNYQEMAAKTFGNGKNITIDATNAVMDANQNLTVHQLNNGEGGTFQTAIGVLEQRGKQLDAAAQQSGWKPDTDLTPDTRPTGSPEGIRSSYERNKNKVISGASDHFNDVYGTATEHGVNPRGIDAAMTGRMLQGQDKLNQLKEAHQRQMEQGQGGYDQKVDTLVNRARRADEDSNGWMMHLNSHIVNPSKMSGEGRKKLMEDVRNDTSYAPGAGADQVEAHLGRNPHLGNEMKQRPGSGKRMFKAPK